MFVDFADDEMALLAELVVDRGADRTEFLQGLHPAELVHRPLSSSEGQVATLSEQIHAPVTKGYLGGAMIRPPNPFRWFDSSPEVIRLAVMTHVRYPLSLRNVEGLLFERRIDICHETVRLWWNRFSWMFAAEIWRKRV